MGKLVLMPMIEHLASITPAVMYEATATKYVMLAIQDFRKLVNNGSIPYRTHPGRSRRIYLKSDLDDYLCSLPCGKMNASEDPPSPADKGA